MEFIVAIGVILVLLEIRNLQQAKQHDEAMAKLEAIKMEHDVLAGALAEALKRNQETAEASKLSSDMTQLAIEDLKKEYAVKLRSVDDSYDPVDVAIGI